MGWDSSSSTPEDAITTAYYQPGWLRGTQDVGIEGINTISMLS